MNYILAPSMQHAKLVAQAKELTRFQWKYLGFRAQAYGVRPKNGDRVLVMKGMRFTEEQIFILDHLQTDAHFTVETVST